MKLGIALLVLPLVAGCSDPSAPSDDLAGARGRWERWGAATYELTIHRSCECLREVALPVIVSVKNGQVQSRTYVLDGAPVADRFVEFFPDVPGLFDLIQQTVARGSTVEARYDAVTGAPLEILVDRQYWNIDGGFGLYARLVTPK
jgi:hypothetical protein